MIVQQFSNKNMKYKKKGEITVFLSLILVPVLGIIIGAFESAKVHSGKLQALALSELALNSAFSEYSIDIFESYGFLCVDTEYRGEDGGNNSFSDHISSYILESLRNESGYDLCRISLKSVEILDSRYIIDCEEQVLADMEDEMRNEMYNRYDISKLLVSAEVKVVYEIDKNKEIYAINSFSFL